MRIALGADHAGFAMKQQLVEWLGKTDHEVIDMGTDSEKSVDYPDFAFAVATEVAECRADFGILVCGSGVGMEIVANKVFGIRAANCYSPEIALLARKHNNANVLTLGARFIDLLTAKEIISVFLDGEFEGGRHMLRVEKIHSLTGN